MKIMIAAFVLALGAPVLAQPAPVSVPTPSIGAAVAVAPSSTAAVPDGSGDPNAITCRRPQVLPGQRLMGPEVCKTNAVWARYRKDGMDVAADGIHDEPSEKWRSTNPQACHPATMGSSNTTGAMQTNITMICE
jgi:hypothetical protein